MINGDGRRQWWTDFLGVRRDPQVSWSWSDETVRRLDLDSFGTVLQCLLIEPVTPAVRSTPIVVLPFYDVESLLGIPSRRSATWSDEERHAKAYGQQIVDAGLAVLLVPWWCEVEASQSGESALDLDGRYTTPAVRHRNAGTGTALGRAVADVMSAVDAVAEICPGRQFGAFGHSLGGKIVLGLAALDDRIAAAVIHEPGLGWRHSNWDAPWYLDAAPPSEPELDELLGLVGPRPCLYIGGGGFDGPENEHLATAAQQSPDGQNLEIRQHDAGHTPTLDVLQECHAWLQSRLI